MGWGFLDLRLDTPRLGRRRSLAAVAAASLAAAACAVACAPASATGPAVAGYPCPSGATCPEARSVALVADGSGGYVLDAHGALHRFGTAPDVGGGERWNWNIARAVALRHNAPGGQILDGYGPLHEFGGAPSTGDQSGHSWPNWDIARSVALLPNGTSGYVLDGYGGLHSFGGAPALKDAAYWSGWDIARQVVVNGTGGGYVLDGFGGPHAIGNAPPRNAAPDGYVAHDNFAKGIALRPNGTSGYVVDEYGAVHPFGGAPSVQTTRNTAGSDEARAIALKPNGTGYVLFADGGLAPFSPNVTYVAVPTPVKPGTNGKGGVSVTLKPYWTWTGNRTFLRRMKTSKMGKNFRLRADCHGSTCPHKHWTAHRAAGLVKPLRSHGLARGTRLLVTVSAPKLKSERVLFRIRTERKPTFQVLD